MKFKNLQEGIDWLIKNDEPDEIELNINVKHKLLYIDSSHSEPFEFKSDKQLLDWIQEQREQIEVSQ